MKLLKVLLLSLLLCLAAVYKADAAILTTTVTVDSKSAPWLSSANPTFHSVLQGPSNPAIITSVQGAQIEAGDTISLQYLSGTVKAGSGWPSVDAGGQTNFVVNDGNFYGQYWASYDVSHDQYPAYAMELLGAFANSSGVVIDAPFVVGNSKSGLIVPVGATQLQLGFNDTYYVDNTGSVTMNVTLQQAPVPEPSSMVLGFMSLAGAVGLRKRNRKSL